MKWQAREGVTCARVAPRPLYKPRTPSCATMVRAACIMPLADDLAAGAVTILLEGCVLGARALPPPLALLLLLPLRLELDC